MFRTVLFSLALAAGLIAAFVAIADAKEPPAAPAIRADSDGATPPPAASAMSPAPDPGAIVAVVGKGWG